MPSPARIKFHRLWLVLDPPHEVNIAHFIGPFTSGADSVFLIVVIATGAGYSVSFGDSDHLVAHDRIEGVRPTRISFTDHRPIAFSPSVTRYNSTLCWWLKLIKPSLVRFRYSYTGSLLEMRMWACLAYILEVISYV